jgi:hypothetical protein
MSDYGADLRADADPIPAFRRFLLFIRDTLRFRNRFWFDRHWTPQAQHLRSFAVNGVPFDMLLRVETMDTQLTGLIAHLPEQTRPTALPRFNAAARPDLPVESYFDDLACHLVHEIYRWDFDLFGYAVFAPDQQTARAEIDLARVNQRLADPHPPHWACLGG